MLAAHAVGCWLRCVRVKSDVIANSQNLQGTQGRDVMESPAHSFPVAGTQQWAQHWSVVCEPATHIMQNHISPGYVVQVCNETNTETSRKTQHFAGCHGRNCEQPEGLHASPPEAKGSDVGLGPTQLTQRHNCISACWYCRLITAKPQSTKPHEKCMKCCHGTLAAQSSSTFGTRAAARYGPVDNIVSAGQVELRKTELKSASTHKQRRRIHANPSRLFIYAWHSP